MALIKKICDREDPNVIGPKDEYYGASATNHPDFALEAESRKRDLTADKASNDKKI